MKPGSRQSQTKSKYYRNYASLSLRVNRKGLEQSIQNTDNPSDAAELVKKIGKLIKCNKNKILTLAYQQRMVFQNNNTGVFQTF